MNHPEVVVPVTFIVFSLGVAMLALYFRHRRHQMFHQERLAAIEKNIQLPEGFFREPVRSPRTYLLRGLIWLFVGIGLTVCSISMFFADRDADLLALSAIGIIPAGVGIAYLIVYRLEQRQEEQEATNSGSSPETLLHR